MHATPVLDAAIGRSGVCDRLPCCIAYALPMHILHLPCAGQIATAMLALADRTLVEASSFGCLVDDQASREADP
jgi:hypothetical protein